MVLHQSNAFRRNDALSPTAATIQPSPKPPSPPPTTGTPAFAAVSTDASARHVPNIPNEKPGTKLFSDVTAGPVAAAKAVHVTDTAAYVGPMNTLYPSAHRRTAEGPSATAMGLHTAAVHERTSRIELEICAKTGPNIRDCVKRYDARMDRRAAAWRSRKSPSGFQNLVNTASRPGTCLYRS